MDKKTEKKYFYKIVAFKLFVILGENVSDILLGYIR